jgi:hypothetical protein
LAPAAGEAWYDDPILKYAWRLPAAILVLFTVFISRHLIFGGIDSLIHICRTYAYDVCMYGVVYPSVLMCSLVMLYYMYKLLYRVPWHKELTPRRTVTRQSHIGSRMMSLIGGLMMLSGLVTGLNDPKAITFFIVGAMIGVSERIIRFQRKG